MEEGGRREEMKADLMRSSGRGRGRESGSERGGE
jgi:hypothetical protein